MINTFTYLMNAYFYQEWWTEYSDPRVSDKEVLVRFASNENIKILNSWWCIKKYASDKSQ